MKSLLVVRLRVEIDDQGRRRVSGSIQRITCSSCCLRRSFVAREAWPQLVPGFAHRRRHRWREFESQAARYSETELPEGPDRQGADKHHHNGNHYGDDGSIDEKF